MSATLPIMFSLGSGPHAWLSLLLFRLSPKTNSVSLGTLTGAISYAWGSRVYLSSCRAVPSR